MTVRAALSVVVALAIVGASAPAIEEARRSTAAETGQREAERIRTATESLLQHSDAVPPDVRGARRHVTIEIPEPGDGTTGLAYVAIGAAPSGNASDGPAGDVVAYRVQDGTSHVVRLPVDVRVAGTADADDRALVVRESARLTLELTRREGQRVVIVSRGFKSEGEASPAHASSALSAPGRGR